MTLDACGSAMRAYLAGAIEGSEGVGAQPLTHRKLVRHLESSWYSISKGRSGRDGKVEARGQTGALYQDWEAGIEATEGWSRTSSRRNVQGVQAEGLREISPQAGEHEVGGEDIALDLYIWTTASEVNLIWKSCT